MSNVLILLIGMFHKMIKNFLIILFIVTVSACRMPDNFGFFQPITMSLEVPDGPPEYKAGWYAGCKSGLSSSYFTNSWIYGANYGSEIGPDVGTGTYQHDSAFQTGFGQGIFACYTHAIGFVDFGSFEKQKGAID